MGEQSEAFRLSTSGVRRSLVELADLLSSYEVKVVVAIEPLNSPRMPVLLSMDHHPARKHGQHHLNCS